MIGFAAAALLGAVDGAAGAQCGKAAWFDLDGLTASGERANGNTLTAAHLSLPFNTKVRVENLANGRAVVVRINDRGPYGGGRVIDVSRAAAEKLGFINAGIARVRVTVVDGNGAALPDSCGSAAPASPKIVEASAEVALPEPRPRPAVGGPGDVNIDAATSAAAQAAIRQEAHIPKAVGSVLSLRFADAFAPEPADPALTLPLSEKAGATPTLSVRDPHRGIAPREDWDRLQQVPN